MRDALEKLLELADVSDDCCYGTLSTETVRTHVRAALAALDAQQPQEGYVQDGTAAWLVETQKFGPILYYRRGELAFNRWIRDPNKATRYHSRTYAESIAEAFEHLGAVAAEHEWPAPTAADARTARGGEVSVHWEVDTIRNEGTYGDGGPDCRSGYDSFCVKDAQGRILFDTLNADDRVTLVHEDFDEDGVHAWDEPSRVTMTFVVTACNAWNNLEALRARVAELERSS